jgi:anti-sigma B factor antagonist
MILRGDLDLLTAALFSERLARAMASQPDGLVLDLARLAFIDCAGARAMAAAGRWLPPGQQPVLRSPGPAICRVLLLTGLDKHFAVEQRATRAPAGGGPVGGRDLAPRAA